MKSSRITFPAPTSRATGRSILLVLLSSAFCLDAFAIQRREPSAPVPDFYLKYVKRENVGTSARARLRNGLTVIVEEYSPRPIAAVTAVIDSGYAAEDPFGSGVSWAVARWMTTRSELAKEIALEGGFLNFSLESRRTLFSAVVPASNAVEVVEKFARLLDSSQLDRFSPEQVWLPAEGGEGYAAWLMSGRRESLLWNRLIPGSGQILAGFEIAQTPPAESGPDREAVVSFHRSHYGPGGLTIVVSGQVLREEVLAGVARAFAGRPPGSAPAVGTKSPEGPSGLIYEQQREKDAAMQVFAAFAIPGRHHEDAAAILLLSEALTGQRGLLNYHLVRGGRAALVDLQSWPSSRGGLWRVHLFPDPEHLDASEVRLLALLESLAANGLQPQDLRRAKARLVRAYMARLRDCRQRSVILAEQADSRDWADLQVWPRKIAALTNDALKAVAGKYFSRSRLCLLEVLPQGAPQRDFNSETLKETFDLLVPPAIAAVGDDEKLRWDAKAEAFELPGPPMARQNSRLRRTSVLRGPEIFVEEEHSAPVVDVLVLFQGGRVGETAENQGITELMLRSLSSTPDTSTEWLVWQNLEANGAKIQFVDEMDFFGFRLQVLSSRLVDVLDHFVRWLRGARVLPEKLTEARKIVRAGEEKESMDLFASARLAIRQAVFPDHGYGLSRFGRPDILETLQLEPVQAWYADLMNQTHPLILLYGDVEGTSFLPDLIPLLSNSKFHPTERKDHPVSMQKASLRLLQFGRSWILGGVPGPALGARDDWTLDVLARLLRLQQFEPDKPGEGQLPVDLFAQRQAFLEGGVFYFGRPGAAGAGHGRDFFEQLALTTQARITEQDTANSVVLTITDFYARKGTDEYVADEARHLVAGEKADYQTEYLATIRTTRVDDLRTVAGRYLATLAHFREPEDNPAPE